MKYLRVQMSDYSLWDIPLEEIARIRAKRRLSDTHRDYESLFDSSMTYFESYPSLAVEWAEENLDWSDIKKCAVMVKPPNPQDNRWFEIGWMQGAKEIVDG